jgi:hypothetical protein
MSSTPSNVFLYSLPPQFAFPPRPPSGYEKVQFVKDILNDKDVVSRKEEGEEEEKSEGKKGILLGVESDVLLCLISWDETGSSCPSCLFSVLFIYYLNCFEYFCLFSIYYAYIP